MAELNIAKKCTKSMMGEWFNESDTKVNREIKS